MFQSFLIFVFCILGFLYIFLAAIMLGQACKDNDLVECDICIVFLLCFFLYFYFLAANMPGQA